jgi:hypothetical protein
LLRVAAVAAAGPVLAAVPVVIFRVLHFLLQIQQIIQLP